MNMGYLTFQYCNATIVMSYCIINPLSRTLFRLETEKSNNNALEAKHSSEEARVILLKKQKGF